MNSSYLSDMKLADMQINSPIVYGCMGLGGGWNQNPVSKHDIKQTHDVIDCALEQGINLFDHADIYTFGKAEQAFGQALAERPELRDQLILQSKCGIRFEDDKGPKRYDFSAEWINGSVEGILTRLKVEHLPILLLHRPDPLMDADDVGQCLNKLKAEGKVGAFGVSNMSSAQMGLLQSRLDSPLIINQLEMSLSKRDWLEQGVLHNVSNGNNDTHSQFNSMPLGTLEYCQQHNVRLQAWGCLSQGLFTGRELDNQSVSVKRTTELVGRLSADYHVSREAIVIAWLLKHPINMMPVIGTTNLARIKACSEALKISLSREHWYQLFVTARGEELP